MLGNLPSFAADATDILQVLDVQHASVIGLVQNGDRVWRARRRPDRAAQPDYQRGDDVRHDRGEQQRAGRDVPRVPDVPDRDQGDDGQAPDFPATRIAWFASGAERRPAAQADARLAAATRAAATAVLHQPRSARDRLEDGLPAVSRFLTGAGPTLATGTFLEQLNPILGWLSLHQQLISDFITQGGSAMAATPTTSFAGNSPGHYLRQFQPTGPETLSFAPSRDSNNRGTPIRRRCGLPTCARPPTETIRRGPTRTPGGRATALTGQRAGCAGAGVERGALVAPALPGASGGERRTSWRSRIRLSSTLNYAASAARPAARRPTPARPSSNDSASW